MVKNINKSFLMTCLQNYGGILIIDRTNKKLNSHQLNG